MEFVSIIVTAISGIIVAVLAYFQKKAESRHTTRNESNKQVSVLKQELEDERERKQDALNAIILQLGACMASGNDKAKLPPLIEAAKEAANAYEKKQDSVRKQLFDILGATD